MHYREKKTDIFSNEFFSIFINFLNCLIIYIISNCQNHLKFFFKPNLFAISFFMLFLVLIFNVAILFFLFNLKSYCISFYLFYFNTQISTLQTFSTIKKLLFKLFIENQYSLDVDLNKFLFFKNNLLRFNIYI
jgi:hypothetical protein